MLPFIFFFDLTTTLIFILHNYSESYILIRRQLLSRDLSSNRLNTQMGIWLSWHRAMAVDP